MKKNTFNSSLNKNIKYLVSCSRYFGKGGAIAVFESYHLKDMEENLIVGEVTFTMQYLSILYSAMTFCATGNFFQKLYFFSLLKKINKQVDQVRKAKDLNGKETVLKADELYMLMSITTRKLQILERLYLLKVMSKLHKRLLADFYLDFNHLQKLANEESSFGLSLTSLKDLGLNNYTFLMAESLLYELNRLSIVHNGHDFLTIKQRIWLYAVHHEKTKDPDAIPYICHLFRAIGCYEEAKNIALRACNYDQLVKSR